MDGTPTRWWYYDPPRAVGRKLPNISWGQILTHWNALETDFQITYGIDLDSGIRDRRTWRWFKSRVMRLLAEDTSLARLLGLRDTKEPAEKE